MIETSESIALLTLFTLLSFCSACFAVLSPSIRSHIVYTDITYYESLTYVPRSHSSFLYNLI